MIKKFILLLLFLHIFIINIFATSVSPDYKSEGLGIFSSISYDNIFNSDYNMFTIDIIEVSLFPSSKIITGHWGIITQFSTDINIFDLYLNLGFTVYPFKKILSFSGNFCFNYLFFILNHFSYMADVKVNIDIPIYKTHNITFGAGLRLRNALRIIDYLNLGDNYYKDYNSYFFEIGYRLIF